MIHHLCNHTIKSLPLQWSLFMQRQWIETLVSLFCFVAGGRQLPKHSIGTTCFWTKSHSYHSRKVVLLTMELKHNGRTTEDHITIFKPSERALFSSNHQTKHLLTMFTLPVPEIGVLLCTSCILVTMSSSWIRPLLTSYSKTCADQIYGTNSNMHRFQQQKITGVLGVLLFSHKSNLVSASDLDHWSNLSHVHPKREKNRFRQQAFWQRTHGMIICCYTILNRPLISYIYIHMYYSCISYD
jgi:hypothetical protein